MATKKKFIDPGGGPGFQSLPFTPDPRQVSGTGEFIAPVTTIKDTTAQPTPILPPLTGTFTDVKTGRPSGLATPQGTFFVQGSDLALLQRQQQEKEALSGSIGQQQGTLAQAASQRAFQQEFQQVPRENLPLGPFGVQGQLPVLTNFLREVSTTKLLGKIAKGEGTIEEISSLGLTPMDLQVLQAGKANISRFSQLIEGIPILGKIKTPRGVTGISIGVKDLTGDSPSRQVELLLKELSSLDGNLETDLQLGLANPFLMNNYLENLDKAEQLSLELQSRIKLLFLQSPELQGNPNNVDTIMAQINEALGKLDLRKLRAGIQ